MTRAIELTRVSFDVGQTGREFCTLCHQYNNQDKLLREGIEEQVRRWTSRSDGLSLNLVSATYAIVLDNWL